MAAKGYWIGNTIVRDMDGLFRYRDANRETMNRYGAKFIIMHGQHQDVEEPERLHPTWTVVEFPSYADAVACYEDPTYHEAAKLRHAVSEGAMAIVEGSDGTQDF
jgi:uncharacterized protein (DUF1330 family)